MLFSLPMMEYFKIFAIYSLALIGVGTLFQTSLNYTKQKGVYLLLWIQNKFPFIYNWMSTKFNLSSITIPYEIEKLITFAELLQNEIEMIEDEHLKEDVKKIVNKLHTLIASGQNLIYNESKNILPLHYFKERYEELSNELFDLFEKNYYRY
jgi:hypothetical protein